MSDAPIGFLDSGSGGLSVWQAVMRLLPLETALYIGDHAYLPYSEKTTVLIRERALKMIKFLVKFQPKLIVVACNTATVAGIEAYRQSFPQLPIIGVVPVVKTAAEVSQSGSFAVLSNAYTAKSDYQKHLIGKYAQGKNVQNLGSSKLVKLVEQGKLSGASVDAELKKMFKKLYPETDVLALGCTHFPFLASAIRAIVGRDLRLLDSGGAVARHVARILSHNQIAATAGGPGRSEFFTTGKAREVSEIAAILLGQPVRFRHVTL